MIFWDNLLRYPKFFISSMIGLILILLNPFIIQLKKLNGKIIFFFFFSLIITLFYILKEMLALE
ncbi:unnamed protein product [Ascophyllum nodosum]|jgi:hypothetical protein